MTPFLALFSFFNGMSSGQEPPPPATSFYGPALTPAERRKWFNDKMSYVSAGDREKKRKETERKKRLELGIIEETKTVKANPQSDLKAKARVERELKMIEQERERLEEEAFVRYLFTLED